MHVMVQTSALVTYFNSTVKKVLQLHVMLAPASKAHCKLGMPQAASSLKTTGTIDQCTPGETCAYIAAA